MRYGWVKLGLLLAAWVLAPAVLAGVDAAALPACDATEFQTLLHAAPKQEPLAARAYWLNSRMAKWPGVDATGEFRLYHSRSAQLRVALGQAVQGADGVLSLNVVKQALPAALAVRFKFVGEGPLLAVRSLDRNRLMDLHKQQLVLVQQDKDGRVRRASTLQLAGALDDLYSKAQGAPDLGASAGPAGTRFRLWAPTAQQVSVCVFGSGSARALEHQPLKWSPSTGVWSAQLGADLTGRYYTYLVDVFVPGVGVVRNRVTDPYAVSLTTDSKRAYIADLNSPTLKPRGWDEAPAPQRIKAATDMVIYELHVRDFSINDASVSAAHRGKYLAFTEAASNGMKHLQALSQAGLTDVHLLPVFDIATIPEAGCVTPVMAGGQAPDSEVQQATVMAQAAKDCFNWGYDPLHFNAPEGSYASDAADGAVRVRELRQMVLALHQAGLRVGMDVVYNHMSASGQQEKSVLDRIVPGYYHRMDDKGVVERSTCCDNTATENLMMGKLMIDSVVLWAQHYRIDSFRFDLMAHQPRSVMETLQERVDQAVGRHVNLIGEGWNFGEVADGARFVQASQLSLNGSGIGTFSDRSRDAVRGGRAGDSGIALIKNQGYVNGLVYDRNAMANADTAPSALLEVADLVRVGLAGSIRDYVMTSHRDRPQTLQQFDYGGQPAGYVSEPAEVVNYVENHDNQTLFDINAYKLPVSTSREDRARVQMLGVAINMFSQGVAYFHAGIDTLRSKSMDGNSFDSGDWFNRLDWRYQENYFGTGLPPKADNGSNYELIKPFLANSQIKPTATEIAWARDVFRDFLKLRASSTLFRLRSAQDIKARLKFFNTGSKQEPSVLVGHLDGVGYPGAVFKEVLYFVNVDKIAHELQLSSLGGRPWVLHPLHRSLAAADKRPVAQARIESESGRFLIPARTALVLVLE
jgi:pullulanase/glycogen debranching enzyme